MNKNSIGLFLLIPAFLLILAPLISFPYGFYTFLRLLITISAAIIIFQNFKFVGGINEISILFGLILILYNPIIPIAPPTSKLKQMPKHCQMPIAANSLIRIRILT